MLAIFILLAGSTTSALAHNPIPNHFIDSTTGKVYTRRTLFELPVNIEAKMRANLKEVALFVKVLPGQWVQQEVAPPTITKFTYQAPQDGEYWFLVAIVDRNGRRTPADLNQEPPQLMVVVDTRPPQVDILPQALPNGELVLRCNLRDSNPDYSSLKLQVRGGDGNWRPLEPVAGMPGAFRVSGPDTIHRPLRYIASDRLGNTITQEIELKNVNPVLPASGTSGPMPPFQGPAPAPVSRAPDLPVSYPGVPIPPMPQVQPPVTAPGIPPSPSPLPPSVSTTPAMENVTHRIPFGPAVPMARGDRKILSSTRAAIEYRLDQVGFSGVGKVDVWITADNGATWQRLCSDQDRQSPAEIELPGEGVFGLRLAVTNGNGFGGTPPAPGDAPTHTVEVDTTPPVVQLRGVEPTATPGVLEIRWSANDKNLGTEPVALYCATRREGPWQLIASKLRNEGVYRWQFPRELGGQFFVRVEVTDQAGNVARAEPATPVLIDMTEPQAQVLGIVGLGGGR